MNTKNNKGFIVAFIAPCIIVLLAIYIYPVLRTLATSLFSVSSITAPVSNWTWRGLNNYKKIFASPDFRKSLVNMFKLLVYGGVALTFFSLIFSVFLSGKNNLHGKHFYRTILYMPNLISAIALGNAFTYFVFEERFGFLTSICTKVLHVASPRWMGPDLKLYSMMFAVIFCSVGYHTMIYISGIERIPDDLYEAAVLDGANGVQQFFRITLPLMIGTVKTSITFWSISALQMFTWNQVFSPKTVESSTISPIVYMYDILFGSTLVQVKADAGVAAAVGVTTALMVQIIYSITNYVLKSDDLEY